MTLGSARGEQHCPPSPTFLREGAAPSELVRAFWNAGNCAAQMGRFDEAEALRNQGIETALRSGDDPTAVQMQEGARSEIARWGVVQTDEGAP